MSVAPASQGTARTDPAVRFAFSNAADGNTSLAVGVRDRDARRRLAVSVGVAPEDLVFMQQVHGAGVATVGRSDRGRGLWRHDDGVAGVDALVTADPGVALVVQVADCVPVLLADPGGAIAAAHAGRAGVAADVVGATLDVMAPGDAAAVRALIGPAIGGCCYEVEPELVDDVAARVPAARATTSWGTASLDLVAAVRAQLSMRGVTAVERVGGCTRCDGDRWYSHRRHPDAGRQAGVVVRGAPDDGAMAGRRGA